MKRLMKGMKNILVAIGAVMLLTAFMLLVLTPVILVFEMGKTPWILTAYILPLAYMVGDDT